MPRMATKCHIINLQKQTQKELEEETPLVNKLKQQQQQKDSNFSYLDLRKSTCQAGSTSEMFPNLSTLHQKKTRIPIC
jgi:hypothetical protein